MSRCWMTLVFCAAALAQQQAQQPQRPTLKLPDESQPQKPASESQSQKPPDESQTPGDVQLPPDEDKTTPQPKQYAFNPVQSKKEVDVGEFYFKKGDYRAAASRFTEATRWNAGNAVAWLRLGDAQERMKDNKAAEEAWGKYLQLAPDAKNASEVRKKLEKLKG